MYVCVCECTHVCVTNAFFQKRESKQNNFKNNHVDFPVQGAHWPHQALLSPDSYSVLGIPGGEPQLLLLIQQDL